MRWFEGAVVAPSGSVSAYNEIKCHATHGKTATAPGLTTTEFCPPNLLFVCIYTLMLACVGAGMPSDYSHSCHRNDVVQVRPLADRLKVHMVQVRDNTSCMSNGPLSRPLSTSSLPFSLSLSALRVYSPNERGGVSR